MKRGLGRFGDALATGSQLVASICISLMATIIFAAVVARYFFGSAPSWSEELPRLLLIWGTLLGAVVAERNGSHLTAGILPLVIKNPRLQKAGRRFVQLTTPVVHLFFLIAFYQFTMRTIRNQLPALHISVGWIYGAGIVAFALLTLVAIVNLLSEREAS